MSPLNEIKKSSGRKVILYIAMTVDGFIATHDDDLTFLSAVEKEGEDYGYNEFIKTIDTVILGRRTYDKVMSMGVEFPHADKSTYIISRTPKADIGNTKFYNGELKPLITKLKSEPGKNIFCDGGAHVVHELLRHNLIDEFYISIIPILLGSGISLFRDGRPPMNLKLVESKSFVKGLVQMHYVKG